MTQSTLEQIINNSNMIVAGYAFTVRKDNLISVININAPYHAALINGKGEVLETNMHDIELNRQMMSRARIVLRTICSDNRINMICSICSDNRINTICSYNRLNL